ncbi:MAG: hypothetical protein KME07_15590 [Pegethrix bostrychoides GSE-TBD4-15B]|uniref:Uncharacterized protein n=1 Tax=Pegethrix bostrychoides GSE-TBD4-15B TaxID=2839662 RepID=A0A951U5U7_9CYAN|nr:hypothetical protein [Pegethrix bostrychoides GSE-TBD4-15B]
MNSRHRSSLSTAQARRSDAAVVAVAPVPAQWLGRNLDFCLLAFCSCVLAVLCHQSIILPSAQAGSGSQMTVSRVSASQLDFLLKAGLFTSAKSQSDLEEAK